LYTGLFSLTPPPPPAAGGEAAGGGVRLNSYGRNTLLARFLNRKHLPTDVIASR